MKSAYKPEADATDNDVEVYVDPPIEGAVIRFSHFKCSLNEPFGTVPKNNTTTAD